VGSTLRKPHHPPLQEHDLNYNLDISAAVPLADLAAVIKGDVRHGRDVVDQRFQIFMRCLAHRLCRD